MIEKNYTPKPIQITIDHEKVKIGKLQFHRAFYEKYKQQINKLCISGNTMFNHEWSKQDQHDFENYLQKL